ncbi:hypothetical protein F8S09_17110 [Deinococcus sp. SDU3-2]|uniref:Uncharacterized protein n=1 Tax=Deinococcus terrestris TaxID=2651870 RepID=A0A7X1NZK0_9DEIO|nr:hypothetical protein [Deinococcus terrestris]MPY68374.1 hypothetical protein [Deinococcus terrestris]
MDDSTRPKREAFDHQERPSTYETVDVKISEHSFINFLATCVVLMVSIGVIGQLSPSLRGTQFSAGTNLNGEYNVASAFNASLFFIGAVLLWLIGRVTRLKGDPFAHTWTLLSRLIFFLALDEYLAIHDKVNRTRDLFGLSGIFYYAWIIPYGLLALVVSLLLIRFLRYLPQGTRNALIFAGVLYVTGALGLELVEAKIDSLLVVNSENSTPSSGLVLLLLIALEELLEMLALVILIATLLGYLRQIAPGVGLRLRLIGPLDEPAAKTRDPHHS